MSQVQDSDGFWALLSKVLAWPFAYFGAWFATVNVAQVEAWSKVISLWVLMACGVLQAWLAWRKRNKP